MEDWEAGRRTPPEYIPRLLAYQIKFEGIFAEKKKAKNKIDIVTDPDGNKIVLINDILFKSRRSINRDDIEQILMHYIGEYYEIVETAEKVYIGSDFPDYGNRHGYKAKNGWYRCDANGKLFLYDIVQIKKETSTPLE
ncbi:hypothetical protein SAMN02910400_00779 [Lachnospiraceae bacterium C10]|nr:hypothetical protein SAMN02910400_00779 [Lachnospiraceae bacterium C10]